MKKRTVKKAASKISSKRVTRPVSRRKSYGSADYTGVPVFFRRFIIITPIVLFVIGLVSVLVQKPMTQEVAGISVFRGMFGQASVDLPNIPQAVSYNVYYKPENMNAFTNAARDIPTTATTYLISYLKKDTAYQYRISAVDNTGAEFWFSPVLPLTNIQSM
jgi:hypothetical protein